VNPAVNSPAGLIDCHAHLDELDDVDSALRSAAAASVIGVVGVGTDFASSVRILEIAAGSPPLPVYPAVGLYPDKVTPGEIPRVLELLASARSRILALGEIGLDYWIPALRKKSPNRSGVKALQKEAFRLQLEAAVRENLPVIVHSRGAWADSLQMVRESRVEKALFHWFSGPRDILAGVMESGYLVSAPPAAAWSPPLREILAAAPIERIVLETDCPVPRKEGHEFIPTAPADLKRSLAALSALKGLTEEETARLTTATARAFFGPGRLA